jgi:hypothetical protein
MVFDTLQQIPLPFFYFLFNSVRNLCTAPECDSSGTYLMAHSSLYVIFKKQNFEVILIIFFVKKKNNVRFDLICRFSGARSKFND